MNEFLAIIATLSIFLYWVICRHDSYQIQKDLAENVKNVINDENVDFKIKRMAYMAYSVTTKWWAPIAYVFLFLSVVPIIILSKGNAVSKNDERLDKLGGKEGSADLINSIMSQCAKYSAQRNPLTFTIITIVGFIFVGLAFLLNSAFSWLSSSLQNKSKTAMMPLAINEMRTRIQTLLAYVITNVAFMNSKR
ncbi:hypothetical protein RX512_002004 [Providencia rettgeri]|nr:hypothetical protein [Providencia rettgeri]